MWQAGNSPTGESTEEMKSLPKVIRQSPIYFSRAMTFHTKGGCDSVFFFFVPCSYSRST